MAGNGKKKGYKWIVILSIVVILLGIIGAVAYVQQDNIEALMYVKKYSAEERQEMLEKNEEAILKILEKVPEVNVKPLPKEAEELLNKGDLSEEDALGIITGKVQLEEVLPAYSEGNPDVTDNADNGEAAESNTVAEGSSTDTAAPPAGETENNQGEQVTESRLEELIAQVYLLKSSFSGRIDSLVAQAKAEYIANKGQNKAGIAGKYFRKGTDMEAECDAQMESLLAEISSELQRTGGDTGIISEIRSAYENEKSIKKAELVAKYS